MNLKGLLKKYRYDAIFILILAVFILLFYLLGDHFGFLSDREAFEDFIESFGIWAPFFIILVIVLEVIIAPIPGFIPVITAGFIFGPWEGALYSFVGNIIGTFLAFFLARDFGKKIILRLAEEKRLNKYAKMIKRNESWLYVFSYFIPILPTDIVSMAFGLSNVKFRKFFIVSSLGFVFYVIILNFFGDKLSKIIF